MKLIPLLALILCCHTLMAQKESLEKGKKVYVAAGSSDDAQKVAAYTREKLSDWGYWKVADTKKEADFVLRLEIGTHGGVTWTSWGGKSVQVMATMETRDGKNIWQSKRYKSSPNGSNHFNSANASVNKLIKGLRTEFGRG